MDTRTKIFSIADELALEAGGIDRVAVESLRKAAKVKSSTASRHLREWKKSRSELAAAASEGLRIAADEMVNRIFILGTIAGRILAENSARSRVAALYAKIESLSAELAGLHGTVGNPGPPGPSQRKSTTRHPTEADLNGGRAQHGSTAARLERETQQAASGGFLALHQSESAKGGSDVNAEDQSDEKPERTARRVGKEVWQFAKNPQLAKAAAEALRRVGYPLQAAALLKGCGYEHLTRSGKAYREASDAFEGSRLSNTGGKWWFAGEDRPTKPRRRQPGSKSQLAKVRKQSNRLRDAVFARLKEIKRPASVGELLGYLEGLPDFPKLGRFNYDWLKQILQRAATSHKHIVKVGSKYRWFDRPGRRDR